MFQKNWSRTLSSFLGYFETKRVHIVAYRDNLTNPYHAKYVLPDSRKLPWLSWAFCCHLCSDDSAARRRSHRSKSYIINSKPQKLFHPISQEGAKGRDADARPQIPFSPQMLSQQNPCVGLTGLVTQACPASQWIRIVCIPANTTHLSMFDQCWPNVVDGGPGLVKHWVDVSCFWDVCTQPGFIVVRPFPCPTSRDLLSRGFRTCCAAHSLFILYCGSNAKKSNCLPKSKELPLFTLAGQCTVMQSL